MTHVATLISNPTRPAVNDEAIAAARELLPAAGEAIVLDPGVAADVPFITESRDPRAIAESLRGHLAPAAIDVVVQPAAGRRKRLFVTDMDSTMIEQECIDELAGYAGLKAPVAAITERAMNGEIAFEPALRERVALLKGLPVAIVDEVIEKRITLMPGARMLVATLRANRVHTCLISGGFTLFTEKIARILGFHEQRGNILVIEADKLAGCVEEPILGREAKLDTLLQLVAKLKITPEEAIAAGDGANDLPMLRAAGMGVAYRAKPAIAAASQTRIDYGDLTALLYLQGYRRDEFAG